MARKITIEIGMNPQMSGRWFAGNFVELVQGDMGAYRAPERTVPGSVDIDAATNRSSLTLTTTRLTHEQLVEGLIDWSEQALIHIEDTPDAWLRNALAIQAGRWNAIDVSAVDWYDHAVCGYIAETHGEPIDPSATTR